MLIWVIPKFEYFNNMFNETTWRWPKTWTETCSIKQSHCKHLLYFLSKHKIPGLVLWQPPTNQFYPECQSPRVLPSSQSTWRIAAPSCIGSRPASRQRIRDARPKRQSQWSSNSIQRNIKWQQDSIAKLLPRPAATQLTATALVSLHVHQDEPAVHRPAETATLFISSRATETITLFIKSIAAAACFKVNTNLTVCARDPTVLFLTSGTCSNYLYLHPLSVLITSQLKLHLFLDFPSCKFTYQKQQHEEGSVHSCSISFRNNLIVIWRE
jgi:hypothetical protein